MTRRYRGLAIDPGMSNGICLFSWSDEEDGYFHQEGVWQVTGGALGLSMFLDAHFFWAGGMEMTFDKRKIDALIVEKFTPRGGPGFSLDQKSAEPLRGEGVIIGKGAGTHIEWGEPSQQYFMGGATLNEKKHHSREFLKQNGIWITGKMVGQPDANDAISAELHAIAWLRRKKHMPTLIEMFTPEEEE